MRCVVYRDITGSWELARTLDPSELATWIHPYRHVGVAWLLRLGWVDGHLSIDWLRGLSLLWSALGLVSLVTIIKATLPPWSHLLAAISLLAMEMLSMFAVFEGGDVPMWALSMASCALAVRAVDSPRAWPVAWLGAGALAGLAYVFRQQAALVAAGLVIGIAVVHRSRPRRVLAAGLLVTAGWVAGSLPQTLVAYEATGNPLWSRQSDNVGYGIAYRDGPVDRGAWSGPIQEYRPTGSEIAVHWLRTLATPMTAAQLLGAGLALAVLDSRLRRRAGLLVAVALVYRGGTAFGWLDTRTAAISDSLVHALYGAGIPYGLHLLARRSRPAAWVVGLLVAVPFAIGVPRSLAWWRWDAETHTLRMIEVGTWAELHGLDAPGRIRAEPGDLPWFCGSDGMIRAWSQGEAPRGCGPGYVFLADLEGDRRLPDGCRPIAGFGDDRRPRRPRGPRPIAHVTPVMLLGWGRMPGARWIVGFSPPSIVTLDAAVGSGSRVLPAELEAEPGPARLGANSRHRRCPRLSARAPS